MQFASAVDVVTFEFENVPAATAEAAAHCALVRPAGDVLHTTQHRLREKTFLQKHGFPVTRFVPIRCADDLERAVPDFGPAILKTAGFGYDGKGQYRVSSLAEAEAAWDAMGRQEAVLEAVVDFAAELSVVGVRGDDGALRVLRALLPISTSTASSTFRSRPRRFEHGVARTADRNHARRSGTARRDRRALRRIFSHSRWATAGE